VSGAVPEVDEAVNPATGTFNCEAAAAGETMHPSPPKRIHPTKTKSIHPKKALRQEVTGLPS